MKYFMRCIGFFLCALAIQVQASPSSAPGAVTADVDGIFSHGFESPPNILLVILDDVGIDQMASFGYGGVNPPSVPSIDAIADGGLRFRNAWSMPECSPGRSAVLTGRYSLRTNVNQAIGPNDLANSHVSPYEVTTPKLLQHAGYESAMFGKFHLGGPDNNAAGNGVPTVLGWDAFNGWIEGVPASIDTTAGGVGATGVYSCGFVPNTTQDPEHGADSGACYVPQGTGFQCSMIASNNAAGDPPGMQCVTRGGILVPNAAACQAMPPSNLVWDRENAHYVSPLVLNSNGKVEEADLSDARGRGYRATLEVNAAIDWIQQTNLTDKPWMATVSFSGAHTPLHHPPATLLPSGISSQLATDCTDDAPLNQRRIYDAMVEAVDTELGRLLVETGLATTGPGGELNYDPAASNTVIVILGDNGSFAPTVKAPFDLMRSKGSAYQTGVWVPLVVSGATVRAPGRNVEHMVNVADLYSLFGELAGVNIPSLVPRVVDAQPMLPYLKDANQGSIRELNFTDGALNLQRNGGRNGPCVISTQCSHTPMTKGVCEDNGGVWWGVGADDKNVIKGELEQCWQVNQAIYHDDPANYEVNRVEMGWTVYRAIRDEHFKLVRNNALIYDVASDSPVELDSEELYLINQAAPIPLLDRAGTDLLADDKLTPLQELHHQQLSAAFDAILASKVPCPGDGNDDGRVDQVDIDNYHQIVATWNGSSVYDMNLDGITDAADLQVIQDHLGTTCPKVP